jgi:hypothetical protein
MLFYELEKHFYLPSLLVPLCNSVCILIKNVGNETYPVFRRLLPTENMATGFRQAVPLTNQTQPIRLNPLPQATPCFALGNQQGITTAQ